MYMLSNRYLKIDVLETSGGVHCYNNIIINISRNLKSLPGVKVGTIIGVVTVY